MHFSFVIFWLRAVFRFPFACFLGGWGVMEFIEQGREPRSPPFPLPIIEELSK